MVGAYQGKSVHLSDIASKILGRAKEPSIVRRLSRLRTNPAVRVPEWYEPLARNLPQSMAQTMGEIRLIADGTKVGSNHRSLMIAVAYRRRALPIAWTWIRCAKGCSSAHRQLALLAYVRRLSPKDVPVLLVGDSEFGAVPAIRQLGEWHWDQVLRQKASHQVKLSSSDTWERTGDLIQKPGQSIWLGSALLAAM